MIINVLGFFKEINMSTLVVNFCKKKQKKKQTQKQQQNIRNYKVK